MQPHWLSQTFSEFIQLLILKTQLRSSDTTSLGFPVILGSAFSAIQVTTYNQQTFQDHSIVQQYRPSISKMFRNLRYFRHLKPLLRPLILASAVGVSLNRNSPYFYCSAKNQNTIASQSPLDNLLEEIVQIKLKDNTIAYAYVIAEGILVTPSIQFFQKRLEKRKDRHELKFYHHHKQIKSKIQILGHFQNLCFIRIDVPAKPLEGASPSLFSRVQTLTKYSYCSINDSYLVEKQGGFGILSGKGQTGSLVISEGKILGLVSEVGKDSERGFLKMLFWRDILNVLPRLNQPPFLGITVISNQEMEGVSVQMVKSNSPFNQKINMGDTILKVNGQIVKNPDDILRVTMLSNNELDIQILREGASKTVTATI